MNKNKTILYLFISIFYLYSLFPSFAMKTDDEDTIDSQQKTICLYSNQSTLTEKKDEKEINNSHLLKGRFRHSKQCWEPYTLTEWKPVIFNYFEGNERLKGNLSVIEVPEDGVYSLSAHYAWHATESGPTGPYTAITINSPDRFLDLPTHHHLAPGYETIAGLSRVTRLNKGDTVMVSIHGSPNAEYYLGNFELVIEKID